MSVPLPAFPDPRLHDAPAPSRDCGAWYALVEQLHASGGGADADRASEALVEAIGAAIALHPQTIADAIANAPSAAVARQLWRCTDLAWARAPSSDPGALAITPFALPVVLLAGRNAAGAGR